MKQFICFICFPNGLRLKKFTLSVYRWKYQLTGRYRAMKYIQLQNCIFFRIRWKLYEKIASTFRETQTGTTQITFLVIYISTILAIFITLRPFRFGLAIAGLNIAFRCQLIIISIFLLLLLFSGTLSLNGSFSSLISNNHELAYFTSWPAIFFICKE